MAPNEGFLRWFAKFITGLAAAALILSAAAAIWAESHVQLRLDIREYRLDNGLQVLVLEDHSAPLTTIQVWYKVGSRNELSGRTGISHLIEHMMFRGSANVPPGVYSETIQKFGGSDNAFTSSDATGYHAVVPSSQVELVFKFESDRMTGALFDEKELKSEREVVKEERRLGENSPSSRLFEELAAVAYKIYPYRRPIIGWMADIAALSRQDIIQYYKSYYQPNNAFLLVVGDVNGEKVHQLAKKYFGPITAGPPVEQIQTIEPPQMGEKRFELLWMEAQLPMLAIAYHIPSFNNPDAFALDVLEDVLLGGESSRLYKNLVIDKQIASSVHGGADFKSGPGLFTLFVELQRGRSPQEAEGAIYEEIERLKTDPISDKELQKALNRTISSFVFKQQSNTGKAFAVANFNLLASYTLVNEYVDKIRKVTKADVGRVAKEYLSKRSRTVGTLWPEKEKKG